jgi:hypothetical protein
VFKQAFFWTFWEFYHFEIWEFFSRKIPLIWEFLCETQLLFVIPSNFRPDIKLKQTWIILKSKLHLFYMFACLLFLFHLHDWSIVMGVCHFFWLVLTARPFVCFFIEKSCLIVFLIFLIPGRWKLLKAGSTR